IGSEANFIGMVDIIRNVAYYFEGDKNTKVIEKEVPANLKEKVALLRNQLIEKISQFDDEFMMKYLDGEKVSEEEIKAVIRKAVIGGEFFPVFCGSAYKQRGVQPLLDGVIDYLPSPLDIPEIHCTDAEGEPKVIHPSDEEPFAALAFKIMTDPFVGKLAFFRVYSGVAATGSYVYNATKGRKERLGRIVQMHANNRKDIDFVYAGDIAAAVLKETTTGDTLCAEGTEVILEKMVFPEPVISQKIEPKTKGDQDKLGIALSKLVEEDPTLRAYVDKETAQTIIAGMGELHLDIIVDRLRRDFKVEVNVGAPEVAYRETLTATAECEGKYVRQSGGRGQYGHVWIKFEPNKDKGFEFVDAIVGGVVPREFIKPTMEGLKNSLEVGPLAGYPMIDVKATLFDGSYHDVDSSEMAYRLAASFALKEAGRKCKPVLLEPIEEVEVTVPQEYIGDVIGDITSRRGQIESMDQRGNAQIVKAQIPLSEMFGYATDLRSFSQGRGTYSMQFSKYDVLPKSVSETILKKNSTNS
ncbi:MAG: elongation factor G, partial [Bacillales bacterium]|nr:elongation factor G [Bacillales bacterium]